MRIKVTGRSPKVSKKLILEAVRFAMPLLVSSRLLKTLNLHIQLTKTLWEEEKSFGDCEGELIDTGKPKKFLVRIYTITSKRKILETLFHELVHVKQYAKGELRDYIHKPSLRFLGKYFDLENDDLDDSYFEQPWEIEAYGREYGLYYMFEKHLDKQKKKS